MPRKFLRRHLPDHKALREQWYLRPFRALLHDPALLYPNRRTATRAFAIGLFFTFVPIPLQMAASALVALWLRVNLPIAIATVWITNPVTMGPIFYAEYRLGAWLLDMPPGDFSFELSVEWLREGMLYIWEPMLLGTLVFSVTFSALGYFILNWIWMRSAIARYRERPHHGGFHPIQRFRERRAQKLRDKEGSRK
ncbi:MAG: DUF2062 domain-containing protein [Gammaproteobacteria bacterium]|nr:DUF2062 domain-containing protein [Gammaproteobacteria bacterium]